MLRALGRSKHRAGAHLTSRDHRALNPDDAEHNRARLPRLRYWPARLGHCLMLRLLHMDMLMTMIAVVKRKHEVAALPP